MKQLNISYEDKEFEIIKKAKNNLKMNWHDLILSWAKTENERNG